MSLAREARRLQKLAEKLQREDGAENAAGQTDLLVAAKKAADYVVGFNMRGLHKIERELFFPWVREKVWSSHGDDDVIPAAAFDVLMDRLDSDRKYIENLGRSLVSFHVLSFLIL